MKMVRCEDVRPFVQEWVSLGGSRVMLAERAGVHEKTIRNILASDHYVFASTADRILTALGVNHIQLDEHEPLVKKNRKLTEEQVREMRGFVNYPGGLKGMARRYGVHFTTVWQIRSGKTWKHLLPGRET